MRPNLVVGILKETKDWEKRSPLSPGDVNWLIQKGIRVEVESSQDRIFPDKLFQKNGAVIVDRFKKASLLIGIKEPQITDLYKDKIYMVFSHTIKGQLKNMPLLKACLKNNITLIDYEKIIDIRKKRMVYFGRFAGICGMIDCLHYYGKKCEQHRLQTPFSLIRPCYEYRSLRSIKQSLTQVYRQILAKGFDKKLSPFIIGITGHGNVSRGAQEILALLNPIEIHPKDMLKFFRHQKGRRHRIYKIVFFREEKLRSKKGEGFYFEEYFEHPEKFESNLDTYLPYINLFIHTSYWDKRFPRMITKKMISRLSRKKIFRLGFIGDLSCDVNGSVELTCRTTTPARATYTYDPNNKRYFDGYDSKGITIFAVDNLPAELPKDASEEFSRQIRDYVYQIAAHGVRDITDHAAIPVEIRRAVITQNGKLSPEYRYLKKHISIL